LEEVEGDKTLRKKKIEHYKGRRERRRISRRKN